MVKPLVVSVALLMFVVTPMESQKRSKGTQNPASSYSKQITDSGNSGAQGAQPPNVSVQVTPPESKAESGPDRLSQFLSWLFGWQFIASAFLVYLFLFRGAPMRVERLLTPFQSLKVFGAEFVLSKGAGLDAESRIHMLQTEVQKKFDQWVRSNSTKRKHKQIIDESVKPALSDFEKLGIRSTLHVPDLLFSNSLYQLLDYYPHSEGKRGRTFSVRFGIIGKAWRVGQSQYSPEVPTDPQRLMMEWGMDPKEAKDAGHGRQSFACVILKSGTGKPLGVFYLDSPASKAFGDNVNSTEWVTLRDAIVKGTENNGLITDLEHLHEQLIDVSAQIHVFTY